MKKLSSSLSVLLFGITFASSAHAQSQVEPKADQVDLTPLVNYFSEYVYRTERPVILYNWFNAGSSAYWKSGPSATDPASIDYVKRSAETFWRERKNNQSGNFYGYGLYTSTDPYATKNFGKSEDGWGLIEMKMPSGIRMLDLTRESRNIPNAEVGEVLEDLGCPDAWYLRPADSIFHSMVANDVEISESCRNGIQKVLQKELKIDAFNYGYGATPFEGCGPDHRVAFVVTSSRWINSDRVKVFTPYTRDATEDRIRIQTIFDRAYDSSNDGNSPLSAKTSRGWGKTRKGILWPDLEGKKHFDNIDGWITKNLYGCSKGPDYRAQSEFEKAVREIRPCDAGALNALPDVPLQTWIEALKKNQPIKGDSASGDESTGVGSLFKRPAGAVSRPDQSPYSGGGP